MRLSSLIHPNGVLFLTGADNVWLTEKSVKLPLLFAVHIRRGIVEGIALKDDPFFVAFTVASAGFYIWALALVKKSR